jgi:uncharacterized membrane protein
MKRATALWISVAFTVAVSIYSALIFPKMPNPTPSHWDINGNVNGYSSPGLVAFLMPAMMLVFLGLLISLPKMSPKNFKIDSWEHVYYLIMLLVIGLLGSLHLVILSSTKSEMMVTPQLFVGLIFLFFAFLGNVIGKVRRNFWVGVRTPWTLANETVWNVVHRRAGQLWVATGIVGAILCWVGTPFWIAFTLLMLAAFLPVVHSYVLWKRLDTSEKLGVKG